MPLYVYQCPEHGLEERFLPVTRRDTEQTCSHKVEHVDITTGLPFPTRGYCGMVMVRMPTAATARFKGTGFYETDYKKAKGD